MDNLTIAQHDYKLNLWISRIKDCRESGLTVAKWCESNNVGLKNYYYWMRKIKREAFDAIPPGRKKKSVKVVNASPAVFSKVDFAEVQDPVKVYSAVTININGIVVDIHDGASEAVILNTIHAIKNIC